MKLSNRETDLLQALKGTTKSALSMIPGLAQAIAGWDSYHRSIFERSILEVINHLKDKVEDIENFFLMNGLKPKKENNFVGRYLIAHLIHNWRTNKSFS